MCSLIIGDFMKYFINSILCFLLVTGCSKDTKTSENKQENQPQDIVVEGTPRQLNLEKSKIYWLGKKVTGEHSGELLLKSGTVQLAKGRVVSGSFVVDMTTIKNTDIESPEYQAKLESHLKSDDFFSVETHKEAIFLMTNVSETGKNEYSFAGDLTIKGITHSISFPGTVNKNDDGTYSAEAKADIDRTLWDIRYGSGKFFEDLGDKMIFDIIELTLDLSTN